MPLKRILHKPIQFGLILFIFGFSLSAFPNENTIDAKIEKIQKASTEEKEILVKELKSDISKYKNTDANHTSVKNESLKVLSKSKDSAGKYGTGKCGGISPKPKAGMSHASKCGTSNDKCSGGKSHGSKCGSCQKEEK